MPDEPLFPEPDPEVDTTETDKLQDKIDELERQIEKKDEEIVDLKEKLNAAKSAFCEIQVRAEDALKEIR